MRRSQSGESGDGMTAHHPKTRPSHHHWRGLEKVATDLVVEPRVGGKGPEDKFWEMERILWADVSAAISTLEICLRDLVEGDRPGLGLIEECRSSLEKDRKYVDRLIGGHLEGQFDRGQAYKQFNERLTYGGLLLAKADRLMEKGSLQRSRAMQLVEGVPQTHKDWEAWAEAEVLKQTIEERFTSIDTCLARVSAASDRKNYWSQLGEIKIKVLQAKTARNALAEAQRHRVGVPDLLRVLSKAVAPNPIRGYTKRIAVVDERLAHAEQQVGVLEQVAGMLPFPYTPLMPAINAIHKPVNNMGSEYLDARQRPEVALFRQIRRAGVSHRCDESALLESWSRLLEWHEERDYSIASWWRIEETEPEMRRLGIMCLAFCGLGGRSVLCSVWWRSRAGLARTDLAVPTQRPPRVGGQLDQADGVDLFWTHVLAILHDITHRQVELEDLDNGGAWDPLEETATTTTLSARGASVSRPFQERGHTRRCEGSASLEARALYHQDCGGSLPDQGLTYERTHWARRGGARALASGFAERTTKRVRLSQYASGSEIMVWRKQFESR